MAILIRIMNILANLVDERKTIIADDNNLYIKNIIYIFWIILGVWLADYADLIICS